MWYTIIKLKRLVYSKIKESLITAIGIFAVGSFIEQLFGLPNAPLALFIAVDRYKFFTKFFELA